MDKKIANFRWMVGHEGTYELPDDIDEEIIDKYQKQMSCLMEYMAMGMKTTDNELSFLVVDAPPYSFANRVNETITVFGPLYSLYAETAKMLNYSTRGVIAEGDSLVLNFVRYRPDFVVSLLWPQLSSVGEIVIENIVWGSKITETLNRFGAPKLCEITNTIDVIELDHIVSPIKPANHVWYSFLLVLDTRVWASLFAFIALLAFCITLENINNRPFVKTFSRFCQSIWLYFSALTIVPPDPTRKFGGIASKLLIVWLLSVLVLKQLIGGDMLSEMVKKPVPIFIDSWDDLLGTEINIHALDPDVMERPAYKDYFHNHYIARNTIFHEDFTRRLTFFSLSQCRTKTFPNYLVQMSKSGNDLAMVPKRLLEYGFHHYITDEVRKRFHISKSGGGIHPYFLMATTYSIPLELKIMNYVIRSLCETGIYQTWLKTFIFGLKPAEEHPEVIEYKKLRFENISGSLYLAFIGWSVAVIVALCEKILTTLFRRWGFVEPRGSRRRQNRLFVQSELRNAINKRQTGHMHTVRYM